MDTASPLVLRRFQIDETGISGAHVWIEARQQGIFNFLLTLIGLDPTTTLKVSRGSISFQNSSVFGSSQISTPLPNIGAFIGGYKKPFFSLLFGVIFSLFGLLITVAGETLGILGLIVGLAFLLHYYLQKTMYIGFETSGGATYGFAFKASLIEGVNVNIDRVSSTIDYVNSLISSATLGEAVIETAKVDVMGGRTTTVQAVPQSVAAPAASVVPQVAPVQMTPMQTTTAVPQQTTSTFQNVSQTTVQPQAVAPAAPAALAAPAVHAAPASQAASTPTPWPDPTPQPEQTTVPQPQTQPHHEGQGQL